ncbi:hypothetical protein OJAV_G00207250 [Oryzias javanicus]|uniref:Beta-galactoside alpha-2,6-sialyltransferase 2 n=1 Tax=Oryzias javanicus TaxID=123683 RepID=A0A437C6C1_ORYJA|nr:hypothetical protein OJAV_G00207250 [Oryzias javanicus]
MKFSMRQWRKLVLAAILAWALLFLGLLSYFLDTRVEEPLTPAGSLVSQHSDTRRLTSIQSSQQQQSVVGVRSERGLSVPRTSNKNQPEAGVFSSTEAPGNTVNNIPSSSPYQAYGSQEANRQNDLDLQSLAAWSSFGTQNVGSDFNTASQLRKTISELRDRTPSTSNYPAEDEEGRENEDDELPNEIRPLVERRADADFVVQQLWRGTVSSGMLSPRLRQAMKDYISANKHHVSYQGHRKVARSADELLCQMKTQSQLRTVDGSEQPFSSLGWAKFVPSVPLQHRDKGKKGSSFKTCAVVSSAGAILHSGLGKEIDSHDAVLRFNAAPTEGYEQDVGTKTTIRIINSQILANPKHEFSTSSIYKNIMLVAWDPAPYTLNLDKWFASPDYDLFGPYVEHRKNHADQLFYILHPSYLWQLWDLIQSNTQENIQPNPPSSGFIGILTMMALCDKIHVYEYIPSMRQTDLCHYHENYYDAACTLGAYHPLIYEKSLIRRMNVGSESDLRQKGRVTLPGFSTLTCDV